MEYAIENVCVAPGLYFNAVLVPSCRKVCLLSHRTVPNEASDHRAASENPPLAEGGSLLVVPRRRHVHVIVAGVWLLKSKQKAVQGPTYLRIGAKTNVYFTGYFTPPSRSRDLQLLASM